MDNGNKTDLEGTHNKHGSLYISGDARNNKPSSKRNVEEDLIRNRVRNYWY